MPITDPQVVKWANERARVICDLITRLDYAIAAYKTDYLAEGIGARITAAGPSEIIVDGSATDGRTPMTGTTLINLSATVNQLRTNFDTAVAGVGATVSAVSAGVQVNGSPR